MVSIVLYAKIQEVNVLYSIILGDKERHKLPHDSKVIHAEFTYYYYPGDIAFPCKLSFKVVMCNVQLICCSIF